MKHWVFDYFGGFLPWKIAADTELTTRIEKFVKFKKLNKVLFKRRIHDINLNVQKKSKIKSVFRKWHINYIKKFQKK